MPRQQRSVVPKKRSVPSVRQRSVHVLRRKKQRLPLKRRERRTSRPKQKLSSVGQSALRQLASRWSARKKQSEIVWSASKAAAVVLLLPPGHSSVVLSQHPSSQLPQDHRVWLLLAASPLGANVRLHGQRKAVRQRRMHQHPQRPVLLLQTLRLHQQDLAIFLPHFVEKLQVLIQLHRLKPRPNDGNLGLAASRASASAATPQNASLLQNAGHLDHAQLRENEVRRHQLLPAELTSLQDNALGELEGPIAHQALVNRNGMHHTRKTDSM